MPALPCPSTPLEMPAGSHFLLDRHHTAAGLLFTWASCYFCIWKGVKSVGTAAKLTVTLPWLFLVTLIIYNATLDGSVDGVKAYIGEWDMSVLSDGEAWSDAAGQIFFTLGATQGAHQDLNGCTSFASCFAMHM